MSRKLASINLIDSLKPIPGADFIELAVIKGWQCVVKKGEFQAGDLCVYFEIDSLLPEIPAFEFLRKSVKVKTMPLEGKEYTGFRLRTMRFKGELSQGLCLPLSVFPELTDVHLGDDVTEILNIMKYEPPAVSGGHFVSIGLFPSFVSKTDEERIQNIPEILEHLQSKQVVMTEKIDGASATYYLDPETDALHCCSRNLDIADGDNIYWNASRIYPIETALRELKTQHGKGFAIQGELTGPNIQANPYKQNRLRFFVFNVFDMDTRRNVFSPFKNFPMLGSLESVPVVYQGIYQGQTVSELLETAKGKSQLAEVIREGLVIRLDEGDRWLSFKVVNNDFLLNEK